MTFIHIFLNSLSILRMVGSSTPVLFGYFLPFYQFARVNCQDRPKNIGRKLKVKAKITSSIIIFLRPQFKYLSGLLEFHGLSLSIILAQITKEMSCYKLEVSSWSQKKASCHGTLHLEE